jgi:ubiquinone/menaquinone biosynthesis C-methylase UbiE
MLSNIYYRLHRWVSRVEERGEYSGGLWQDKIRRESVLSCQDILGRILEVGCGEGLFLAQLAQARPGLELWGIDNSSVRIEQARVRLEGKNVHLTLEDAAKLSFPEDYFDAVICINVFFNLASKEAVKNTLSQMRRVCKRGGRLIFDFRNGANFLLRLKYKLAPLYDRTIRNLPLKTYYPTEIQALVNDCGLRIVKQSRIGALGKRFAPIILIQAEKL